MGNRWEIKNKITLEKHRGKGVKNIDRRFILLIGIFIIGTYVHTPLSSKEVFSDEKHIKETQQPCRLQTNHEKHKILANTALKC